MASPTLPRPSLLPPLPVHTFVQWLPSVFPCDLPPWCLLLSVVHALNRQLSFFILHRVYVKTPAAHPHPIHRLIHTSTPQREPTVPRLKGQFQPVHHLLVPAIALLLCSVELTTLGATEVLCLTPHDFYCNSKFMRTKSKSRLYLSSPTAQHGIPVAARGRNSTNTG